MRILVHEFATGGGLAGRDVPAPLAREGRAMLAGLLQDLSAIGCHDIVTTVDARLRLPVPLPVEVVRVCSGDGATLDRLIATVDAVWLIAPETGGCLERLAGRVERLGRRLLGSCTTVIRTVSNKATLPRRLRHAGVRHPATRLLRSGADSRKAASEVGYPVIVKPTRGAGCEGVCLANSARELGRAVRTAHNANGAGPVLVQHYVRGMAASVSLLANGRRTVPLSVNAQHVHGSFHINYRGGQTPLDHPLAEAAADAAVQACGAFPGLCGFVGVDVVLTDRDAVVIEVNPRLTTAYIGVRAALEQNVAELTLAACGGVLPRRTSLRRHVRFTAAGRLLAVAPLRHGWS